MALTGSRVSTARSRPVAANEAPRPPAVQPSLHRQDRAVHREAGGTAVRVRHEERHDHARRPSRNPSRLQGSALLAEGCDAGCIPRQDESEESRQIRQAPQSHRDHARLAQDPALRPATGRSSSSPPLATRKGIRTNGIDDAPAWRPAGCSPQDQGQAGAAYPEGGRRDQTICRARPMAGENRDPRDRRAREDGEEGAAVQRARDRAALDQRAGRRPCRGPEG